MYVMDSRVDGGLKLKPQGMNSPGEESVNKPTSNIDGKQNCLLTFCGEDEMSTLAQSKTKSPKNGQVKKKTAVVSIKKKKQPKPKNPVKDSHSEVSSDDEEFLEGFDSNDSDLSSSTDSDNFSEEFSDEDKLMEYYEKKLREHAILGNIGYNSDSSEGSEPPEDLKRLVEDTFKHKPSRKRESIQRSVLQVSNIPENKEGRKGSTKTVVNFTHLNNVSSDASRNQKRVIKGVRSILSKGRNDGGKTEPNTLKEQLSRSTKAITSRRQNNPTKLHSGSFDLSRPENIKRTESVTTHNPSAFTLKRRSRQNRPRDGTRTNMEVLERHHKVTEYLERMREVHNSISEINNKINMDEEKAGHPGILRSARAALLEQHKRNKNSSPADNGSNDVRTLTSGSTSGSETESTFSEKHRDEVVDRILNATLGVS